MDARGGAATGLLMAALMTLPQPGCADTDPVGDGGGGVCQPGQGRCVGMQAYTCSRDGMRWVAGKLCVWPESCNAGVCTDPCALSKATRSYVGCEYFAVDLQNATSSAGYRPDTAQFALVVSYAGKSEHAVRVKIFAADTGHERVVAEEDVFPGGIKVFELGPANVDGTGLSRKAFRVLAQAPVTVYQFNPLNNTEEAYSNDASLLLPVPSLDREYIAVTGDAIVVNDVYDSSISYNLGAFVAVVGVRDNTRVTITPTAPIRAGAQIPAGSAPVTRTIDRYEVLSVASVASSAAAGDGNLSGTRVSADHPVAVFAGNGATVVPKGPQLACCGDHVEEQLLPLSAWGKTHVAPRSRPRITAGAPEADWWRITGGADGITLSYQPARPAGAPAALDRGQSVQFAATASFVVRAAGGPILLAQFLGGANHTGDMITTDRSCTHDDHCKGLGFLSACKVPGYKCAPVGDPAMTLVPPVEQFLTEVAFLVPSDYLFDIATVVMPVDASVTLDGKPLAATPSPVGPVGNTTYGVLHHELDDGEHRIGASAPVGVLVHGLGAYVSYGYPAGLDLKRINIK